MDSILFVSSKLIVHRIFMMFEFGASGRVGSVTRYFRCLQKSHIFTFWLFQKKLAFYRTFSSDNTTLIPGNSNIIRVLCTINFEQTSYVVAILKILKYVLSLSSFFNSITFSFILHQRFFIFWSIQPFDRGNSLILCSHMAVLLSCQCPKVREGF